LLGDIGWAMVILNVMRSAATNISALNKISQFCLFLK